MALGRKNRESNLTLHILKIKTKDEEGRDCSPFFQISRKEGNDWKVVEGDKEDTVSGKLFKVEAKTGEWNGEPIQSASFFLRDGNDAFLLDLRYNIISKSIINSLLNVNTDKEVEISLYTNKRGYASASVRSEGETVDWKYTLDELPQPTVVHFKGKDQRDYTAVDSFFHSKVKELGESLQGKKVVEKVHEPEVASALDAPEDDGIPF